MGGRAGRRARSVALLAALVGLVPATAGASGVFKYVDADGTVHFTDAPTDRRFREIRVPTSRVRLNYYPSPKSLRALARTPLASPAPAEEYDAIIGDIAQLHGVPAALVNAVIRAESRFDARAVSSKGAQGLMQLMPGTADMMGVEDPFEPRDNVGGGVRYLRQLLDRFGDPVWAVAAYNAGPEAVDRHGGIPPYPETREYVRRVMSYYRDYGDVLP